MNAIQHLIKKYILENYETFLKAFAETCYNDSDVYHYEFSKVVIEHSALFGRSAFILRGIGTQYDTTTGEIKDVDEIILVGNHIDDIFSQMAEYKITFDSGEEQMFLDLFYEKVR